jgi:hypothetical protein
MKKMKILRTIMSALVFPGIAPKTILPICLVGFALAVTARADTLVNNFDAPFDYLATGIIGDTNWDGVFLGAGDIPGGSAGGDGSGVTVMAGAGPAYGGVLTVQSHNTSWAGNGDDGFFLYKWVNGDFDASVLIFAPFEAVAYHFPGLLARAAQFPSGSPLAGGENLVNITRFQLYGIGEHVRYVINGVDTDGYLVSPGDSSDTATSHYIRLTRVGNVFSFYNKTNQVDTWNLMGTLTREDLAGLPMQVGLQQATFTDNSPTALFSEFQLSGPNVTFPVMPTAPSGLTTTATNTSGSLTFSWTGGTPGNSSLVVMSRKPIQHNPVQGKTYTASSAFGATNALLGGAGEYVVYNGTGNSVTVTGLGANNLTYYVAVYEYSGSGSSTVYNTASPANNAFPGPGMITSVAISFSPASIPTGGAAVAKLYATFSTGETGSDQTANASWSTGDSGVAIVDLAGTVSGVASGSTTVSASFGTFNRSATITVTGPPVFSDTFTTARDFLADGLAGSTFDNLFMKLGDVPGGAAGADGAGATAVLDSQISTNIGLTISSVQSTWQGAGDDGPFMSKVVAGDFQALVHINSMNTLNGAAAGIMARLYNPANGGPGPNAAGREYHVNYWKIQNGTTSVRRTEDGVNRTILAAGPAAANGWLLIARVNATNFFFFEKAADGDAWTFTTNTVLAAAANNAPMQVGIAEQSTLGVNAITIFDAFSIDGPGIVSPTGQQPPPPATSLTATLNTDLSMTFNWIASSNGIPAPSILVMRAGAPVSAQPSYGIGLGFNSQFGAGQDLGGGNYIVYKSDNFAPSSSNHTVTVTGLTPGVAYYAVCYSYVGGFGTRVFNAQVPANAKVSLQDGGLLSIDALPTPPVPLGGIGFVQVMGNFSGGARLNVSPYAVVTSGDTNVIKVQDGILTGVGLGTATVTVIYSGFTNVANVTVRPAIFNDNFNVSHDYLNNGVTGTPWDGVYKQAGVNEVPDSPYVVGAGAGTTVADANISSNNVLTITASGDGWENDVTGGFFLYKYAPGDFQMAIHIANFDIAGYNQPGLLARAFSYGTNGTTLGAPFVIGSPRTNSLNIPLDVYGESWVSFCRFEEFGIGSYARRNIDSAVSQNTQPDINDLNWWLLIVRSNGGEFDFYKRMNETDPWRKVPNKTHYSIPEFVGQAMQVGIMSGPWGGPSTVQFEKFMLDTGLPTLSIALAVSGNNIEVSWPAGSGTLQYTLSLSPANWLPVTTTPVTVNGTSQVTLPVTASSSFYRLVR